MVAEAGNLTRFGAAFGHLWTVKMRGFYMSRCGMAIACEFSKAAWCPRTRGECPRWCAGHGPPYLQKTEVGRALGSRWNRTPSLPPELCESRVPKLGGMQGHVATFSRRLDVTTCLGSMDQTYSDGD